MQGPQLVWPLKDKPVNVLPPERPMNEQELEKLLRAFLKGDQHITVEGLGIECENCKRLEATIGNLMAIIAEFEMKAQAEPEAEV